MEAQINKPKGVFGASTISQLLAGGTGKTRMNCIIDRALDMLGIKSTYQSEEMRHGIATEAMAYTNVVEPLFTNSIYQSDIYIPINENCGASPDVLIDINDTLDLKCPSFHSFMRGKYGNEQTQKSYKDQVQMQLLATGGTQGILLYYLSKPITCDNADNWENYKFKNFEDCYYYTVLQRDEAIQQSILDAVEKAAPERDKVFDLLCLSEILDFEEIFEKSKEGLMYRKIKEAPNLEYLYRKKIFMYEGEYFYWQN